MYENLAILAAFIFLYSIASSGLEKTPVNGALVFTAFGLSFGPLGLGYLHLNVGAEVLRTLAEITPALALITWVAFGAAVIGQSIGAFNWAIVFYAALSLTVVRMLPVFLVLAGMKLRSDEKLFIGWFGPRGLASIVFAVIVLNQHLPGGDTIAMTVVCTILLSIIAHGLSANPLVSMLAARLKHTA